MSNIEILKRLYKEYTKKYLSKIFLAVFFSILVAGSTSSIAYLLDPAIEKIFIDQDVKLMYLIPIVIVVAFFCKGMSLYLAKVLMIHVSQELKADVQKDMMRLDMSCSVFHQDFMFSRPKCQLFSTLKSKMILKSRLV